MFVIHYSLLFITMVTSPTNLISRYVMFTSKNIGKCSKHVTLFLKNLLLIVYFCIDAKTFYAAQYRNSDLFVVFVI